MGRGEPSRYEEASTASMFSAQKCPGFLRATLSHELEAVSQLLEPGLGTPFCRHFLLESRDGLVKAFVTLQGDGSGDALFEATRVFLQIVREDRRLPLMVRDFQ